MSYLTDILVSLLNGIIIYPEICMFFISILMIFIFSIGKLYDKEKDFEHFEKNNIFIVFCYGLIITSILLNMLNMYSHKKKNGKKIWFLYIFELLISVLAILTLIFRKDIQFNIKQIVLSISTFNKILFCILHLIWMEGKIR